VLAEDIPGEKLCLSPYLISTCGLVLPGSPTGTTTGTRNSGWLGEHPLVRNCVPGCYTAWAVGNWPPQPIDPLRQDETHLRGCGTPETQRMPSRTKIISSYLQLRCAAETKVRHLLIRRWRRWPSCLRKESSRLLSQTASAPMLLPAIVCPCGM